MTRRVRVNVSDLWYYTNDPRMRSAATGRQEEIVLTVRTVLPGPPPRHGTCGTRLYRVILSVSAQSLPAHADRRGHWFGETREFATGFAIVEHRRGLSRGAGRVCFKGRAWHSSDDDPRDLRGRRPIFRHLGRVKPDPTVWIQPGPVDRMPPGMACAIRWIACLPLDRPCRSPRRLHRIHSAPKSASRLAASRARP